jgi:hypothetical protein
MTPCPHCGRHFHRTHHCRAHLPADPPVVPDHAELMAIMAEARAAAARGDAPRLEQLTLVDAPLSNDHPSNRGGRA